MALRNSFSQMNSPNGNSSSSNVSSMITMDTPIVWIPDPEEGFILGRILDIKVDEVVVKPLDERKSAVTCEFSRVFPATEDAQKEVDDNCALMNLNEATLLNNIRNRYAKDKIYTYVANILIAVNPYFEIKRLYSPETMRSYQGKSLGVLPPHIFAIADKTFRDMKVTKQSQSIIVSGESGAGKTESTKYLLKYLCDLWGSKAGPIEQKILDANPILEAFGNAKTTRNNNSSRFGKFMEVHFDSKYTVVGGYISHYLLEKSRVCRQSAEERNYHVFYLICAGAPDKLRAQLRIGKPDEYNYLKRGCTQYFTNSKSEKQLKAGQISDNHKQRGNLKDAILDDVEDFKIVDEALSRIGLSENEKYEVYSTVSAVLHLGNIEFEENSSNSKGGSMVTPSSEKSLMTAAGLLHVDPDDLRQGLLTKILMTNRGGLKGTVIMVQLKVHEANNARDALAKALYRNLFDYIVNRINASIPFNASSYYIGVLDIAGFEYFTVNSFEQFCINYCNEKLQQFFNERILKDEQELYQREHLNVQKISFIDNQDCIDLIEAKNLGILSLLDEESKLPKPSGDHFTAEVHGKWAGHFRIAFPRTSKLKIHRELRDDEGFLVRHFAGAVCYKTEQFLEKNNDALHTNLEGLIRESRSPFVRSLFQSLASNGVTTPTSSQAKGKLAFISVGSKFRSQLAELMDKLKGAGTSFVKCIKPNQKMVDHVFEGGNILSQLQCSGMTSVLQLMHQGFPSRCPFNELYSLYEAIMPEQLARLDSRLFCKALFRAIGMSEKDYKFGVSKVFFRPGKFAEFDAIMRSDPENLKAMISKVKKWLIASRWKKSQWCALSVVKLKNKILYRRRNLIVIQKNVRMFIAKRKHYHRFRGLMNIKNLQVILNQMQTMIGELKSGKEENVQKVKSLQKEFEAALNKIKFNESITVAEVDELHSKLMTSANNMLMELRSKITQEKLVAKEESRLKQIQRNMESEKHKISVDESKKRENEEIRKKKINLELRRKIEEEEERQILEFTKATNLYQVQEEQQRIELELRQRLEQERRDHELALRLARETNVSLDDLSSLQPITSSIRESQNHSTNSKPTDKYDLTKWKYSQLRDTINTSCDIKLLEACRVEFHRRLKVYHAWKAKNNKHSVMDENERVPRSILEEANRPRSSKTQTHIGTHRYFRVPFMRPSDTTSTVRGMWYAHFDGQFIARQMEIHSDKPPILLIAGKDDMQMCELSLEETGLTRRRGAEILDSDFEKEWIRYGGKPYVRRASNGTAF